MFGRHRTDEDDPVKAQASWEIAHGTDQHDRTPDQDRRAREHAGMVNAGLDVAHVGFAQWLVRNGRVTP